MSERTHDSRFVILDMPPKEENLQIPGPYTRSPSLSPRANPAAEAVTLTIDGQQVKVLVQIRREPVGKAWNASDRRCVPDEFSYW